MESTCHMFDLQRKYISNKRAASSINQFTRSSLQHFTTSIVQTKESTTANSFKMLSIGFTA